MSSRITPTVEFTIKEGNISSSDTTIIDYSFTAAPSIDVGLGLGAFGADVEASINPDL